MPAGKISETSPTRSAAAALLLLLSLWPARLEAQRSALAYYHQGERLYEAGDLAGALQAFERAYALDSKAHRGERVGMHFEDYDPAFQLGRTHARLGNFEEAERFFAACAASGYTARSGNAEEFRRWRALVERTLSTARERARVEPTHLPPPLDEPAPTRPPQPETMEVLRETLTPLPDAVALIRPSPPSRGVRTTSFTRTPTAAAILEAPLAVATPLPTADAEIEALPEATPESGDTAFDWRPLVLAFAAGGLTFLLLLRRLKRHRPFPIGEGVVDFGRYAITGLLGTGRTSFVYDARERRSGRRPVALRIRRPDRPRGETERFSREAAALELLRRSSSSGVPAPNLIARGLEKTPQGSLEYLALEKLSGRTLLSLSRNGGKRLDPALSIEILREIAAALRTLRKSGLVQDELAAEDVFLTEPVPVNAGNPIHFKLLGLCAGTADPRRDAASLAAIAAELFRGRAASWDKDEWVAQHIPPTLREALLRARDSAAEPASSFDDVEKALIEATRGFRPEGMDPR